MTKKVPLVIYVDGKRQIIGEAEVKDGSSVVIGTINRNVAERLGLSQAFKPGELSISDPEG